MTGRPEDADGDRDPDKPEPVVDDGAEPPPPPAPADPAPAEPPIGTPWTQRDSVPLITYPGNSATVDALSRLLHRAVPISLVVTGPSGAGRTSCLRLATQTLITQGWKIVEHSTTDFVAGATYIGMLEERIRRFLHDITPARRCIWYCPDLQLAVTAGAHSMSPRGIIDLLMPAIEAGELCVIADMDTAAWQQMLRQRPRMRALLRQVPLDEPTPAQCEPVLEAIVRRERPSACAAIGPQFIAQAVGLARQYLTFRALPGSAIELVREVFDEIDRAGRRRTATRAELLAALTTMTGLPALILDEEQPLDPARMRAFFAARILGQEAAVDCVVERIALLKAGLTDPGRPIGVLLFAGPTGTGKTELAKALAEFLFSSPERLVRIDMSELHSPAAVSRLIGSQHDVGSGEALVHRIAAQPFSVVLLDEFEKAHPAAWDLLLQVFDDGRLTDSAGQTVDFRHTLLILTSNLGATAHRAPSPGFTAPGARFDEAQIHAAIAQVFRPEFINRIDRVIVFNPLTRTAMRDVLRKEVRRALERRGFRDRPWAVEVEESAIDFLLEVGFSAEMGARPLRRAIEQHLLAPMALTIAARKFPQGDQFLFLQSDGSRIVAEFVDPDGPQPEVGVEAPKPSGKSRPPSIRAVLRAPRGDPAEVDFLLSELSRLESAARDAALGPEKQMLLSRMREPLFWQSERRIEAIERLERLDRFDAGLRAAQSISARIREPDRVRDRVALTVTQSLASQLLVLSAGLKDLHDGHPFEVVLEVIGRDADAQSSRDAAWVHRLTTMYLRWAARRRFQVTTVAGALAATVPPTGRIQISGPGVFGLLRDEPGLHLLEKLEKSRRVVLASAVVRVGAAAPMSAASADPSRARPTRRYREGRSPLVKDLRRGWSTGLLEHVLDGEFDLFDEATDS